MQHPGSMITKSMITKSLEPLAVTLSHSTEHKFELSAIPDEVGKSGLIPRTLPCLSATEATNNTRLRRRERGGCSGS